MVAYTNSFFNVSVSLSDSDSVALDQYFPQYVAEGNAPVTSTVRGNGGRIVVE